MAENNNKVRAAEKAGEFKGTVKTQIENIGKDIREIKTSLAKQNDLIIGMKVKMAAIGAIVSFAVTIMVLLIKEILAK